MKIEIQGDNAESVVLSNDTLENENYVDISLENKESNMEVEITVPLDELISAVNSFIQLRNQRWKRDAEYNQRYKFIK